MSRWPNKHVIGLTGNIAVGKSVVRQMLQHLGAYTIDADGLTHQATAPGAPAYATVVETFGRWLLDGEGRIDRAKLGTIVFTYPDALARLEALVHPVVIQAINTLVTRAQQPIVVIEAIKLLESDLAGMVDTVWVVDATEDAQARRLMEKRGMTADDAQRRIAAQPPQADKVRRASVVISNSGSVEDTWKQVQAAWTEIARPAPAPAPVRAPAPAAQPAPAAAPAAQQPAPAPAPAPASTETMQVDVKRGMPNNAELIARFISQQGSRQIDRMDIMMAFGQKSYLLAQAEGSETVVALIGWQVENLITRADEFYIAPSAPRLPVINALVTAIEDASRELQSEVCFIMLPASVDDAVIGPFVSNGYELTTMEQIRIPAWREAVHELVKDNPRILTKKLRADRVMKPI